MNDGTIDLTVDPDNKMTYNSENLDLQKEQWL